MNLKSQLTKYLPANALDISVQWIVDYKFQLKISKERITKIGDFRPPNNKVKYPRITVNHNLNKYAFLVTFVHEVAHLVTYNSSNKRLLPHGKEWKANYTKLLKEVMDLDCFPKDLEITLHNHINNPSASSCVDTELYKALRAYDEIKETLLEEIDQGAFFKLRNGKVFRKGQKIRKRFECIEVFTNRKYAVSPIADVRILNEKDIAFIKSQVGDDYEERITIDEENLAKISSLKKGTKFITNKGDIYILGDKIRTRYECIKIKTEQIYSINGNALVQVIENK